MKTVERRSAWTVKLMESIEAGRFEEAERMLCGLKTSEDPLTAILGAEVDLYFGRLESARERLVQIKPWMLDIRSLLRYLMALGQLDLEQGQWDHAQETLEGACCVSKVLDDRCHLARGLYYLGEVKFKRGEGESARALWEQARGILAEEETARGDYLLGLLHYAMGTWYFHAGRIEEARAALQTCLRLLDEEHGRYYALALGKLGAVLACCGQEAEALPMLREAHRVLVRYALGDSLAEVTGVLATTLIRTGQFEEAEQNLRESAEVLGRIGHARGLGHVFHRLAEVYFEQNDLARAEKSARTAIEYAEAAHDDTLRAEAHILLGRAATRRRDPEVAERALLAAREIARGIPDQRLEGLACLYLSEACYAVSPMKAQDLIGHARELLRPFSDPRIEREIERVAQRAMSERIRLTPDNKLIFDGDFLPNWYVARETLERFLLKNALRQAEGNLTKAGELLGITKVHVHNLRRQFNL